MECIILIGAMPAVGELKRVHDLLRMTVSD